MDREVSTADRCARRPHWIAALLLLSAAWLTTWNEANAQASAPPSDPVLLQRLEQLEKQNENLQQQLLDLQRWLPVEHREVEKLPEPKKDVPPPPKKDDPLTFEVGKDLKMGVSWRDGIFMETADQAFKFSVGGRVDYDNGWYSASDSLNRSIGLFNDFADPNLGLTDGTDFRRARLRFQGTMWEVMEFNCEYDFANFLDQRRRTLGIPPHGRATPPVSDFEPGVATRITDCWMGFKDLPVIGTVRAGHQKEWITFTNATSGRFLTFLERPLLFDAFNNNFQFSSGLSVQNNLFDQRAYYWLGFFRTNSNLGAFDVADGDYAFDARFTVLPVWLDEGNVWLHLGVDYSHRALHFNQTRFRGRPLVFTGTNFQVPNIVNTGAIFTHSPENLINFEFATAWGPFTLASEYTMVFLRNTYTGGLPLAGGRLPAGVERQGNYFAQGWYVEALYFLTGDHRGYRPEQPGYDRIKPITNFFLVRGPQGLICGRGAWEVGCRYDYLDLSHNGINGGVAHAVTLGLNWHVNPNMKVQWNYVWMDRNFSPIDDQGRRPGSFDSLGMRFHWDF